MQVVSPWEVANRKETPSEAPAPTEFSGRRWRLFWLALRTGILTVLSLGIYRFWMKTKLRRWYWSSWRPCGHPLEYVGEPWEKLLGFLIAVVFLAFYIGIVNLLLMFASFSLFNGNFAAYFLSFIGVIPLWFYARYRARRYVLARTRWRGVRFGLVPGAWGYAVRAIWHWFLTLMTLGYLWPRKAFYLEKYITDRTYFGTQQLQQSGEWRALKRPFLGVWLPLFAFAVSGFLTIVWEADAAFLALGISAVIAPFWAAFGMVNYNVKKLRYLTNRKSVGDVKLSVQPRFWVVTGIYFWGYLLAGVVVTVLLIPMGVIGVILLGRFGSDPLDVITYASDLPRAVLVGMNVVVYFLIFLIWSTLMHALIRYPLMRHYASTLSMSNSEQIDEISQRPRDEFGEAEGFAEALDVGAAI